MRSVRRRPNLAGWPAARMVTARRMGRLVASCFRRGPAKPVSATGVCFLAYVLWKTLEQWQSRAGLGNSPRTLLQELAAITSTDVIVPTAAPPAANCDCAASRAPITPKRYCWSASVSASPNDFALPRGAHNVVSTLGFKYLKSLARAPETAEVGLARVYQMCEGFLTWLPREGTMGAHAGGRAAGGGTEASIG